MWKFVKTAGIFTGLFAVSFSAAFISQYKKTGKSDISLDDEEELEVQTPLTDKQRVLNSLLEIKTFEVDGNMEMMGQDNTYVNLKLSGQGDISDFEDIKIQGYVDASLNGTHLKADFGYFDEEVFLSYNESYFRLETSKILEFVQLLPSYGLDVSIPTEIEEIDLGMVESYFDDMSDKELTPDGKNYYFTINLSEDVSLYVVTDLDLNFSGLRTGLIDYKGMAFKLNVNLNRLDSVNLVSPKNTSEYAKYQDFSPALKLFDGVYALTQKKQNTINADIKVRKTENGETKQLLETNVDLTYDLASENHTFGLNGELYAEKKTSNGDTVEVVTPYSFAIYNKTLYAHYGDVAISITTDSLTELLQFILEKIGDEKINSLLDKLVSGISSTQVVDLASQAGNLLGTITLTEDELDIDLNTSNFSTTTTDENGNEVPKTTLSNARVVIKFNASTGALESISLKDFSINDYSADLVLTFGEYRAFNLDAVHYQSVDHLLGLTMGFDKYIDMTKFRIEFDANISKDPEVVDGVNKTYNDILVDGGLQFELDPLRNEEGHINVGYGYGELNITDRKSIRHNVKVDMKDVNEVLLSYSTVTGTSRDANVDPMNVKIKVQTIKDLVEIISTLVKNPDEHFNELFGGMLNTTGNLPIKDIIAGDYLQLLSTNLINRFEVGQDYIEIDIAMDIIGMEDNYFTTRIEFTTDSGYPVGLKALKVSNLSFEGLNIEFNAYLKDFDESLESTRLPNSIAADYIDFSDLKVLLELGINTSKNNYYHFTASANVSFTFIDLPLDVPLDIKVWTKNGDVKVSVDLTDIPTIWGVNVPILKPSTDNRVGHIYYHDGMFYVQRTEEYTSGVLLWKTTHYVEFVGKYNVSDFLDNAIVILCKDVLCLNDTFMDLITSSIEKNNDPNYQMKYENILNGFLYSPSGHYFYFDINLAEIANNDQLSKFTVKVRTDSSCTNLVGLDINLIISFLGDEGIALTASLDLADCAEVADASNNLTALDTFEARLATKASGYEETFDRT